MTDRPTSGPTVPRLARAAIRAVLLLGAAVSFLALVGSTDAAGANPVQTENASAGDSSWRAALAATGSTHGPSSPINGYLSEVSAAPGDTLHFHISSPYRYRIEISRLGWYGGSGGRLMTCLPGCGSDQLATPHGVPATNATTGWLDVGWPVTQSIVVPGSWTTGYYAAAFIITSGASAGRTGWAPFIVRASSGARSPVLVVAPVNTWQAYNAWGGKSLYAFNSTGGVAATKVSFNRPYANANGLVFGWEYNLTRFLERQSADISYTTDVDIANNPSELLNHRLVVVAGHDEYWDKTMRDAYQRARDTGHNLAFFGADIADWQVRYENTYRTLVEYRTAAADPQKDPTLKTTRFSRLATPRPPCELVGVQFSSFAAPADTTRAYGVVAAGLSDPLMVNTGLTAGETLPGTVGYEWDSFNPSCGVPQAKVLLHWQGSAGSSSSSADSVVYTAASGARVFSTGSLQFNWGLDSFAAFAHPAVPVQPALQVLVRNLLDQLAPGAIPAPPPTPAPPPPVPPKTSIRISGLAIRPSAFRAAGTSASQIRRAAAAARHQVGAVVSFRIAVANHGQLGSAALVFTVDGQRAGRQVNRRCVAQTRSNRAGHAPCKLWVRLGKTSKRPFGFAQSAAIAAGLNRVRFNGRVAGSKLRPGFYRIVAFAIGVVNNTSAGSPSSASNIFQIVSR